MAILSKAAIILESVQVTEPGHVYARPIENALRAMGIDVFFLWSDGTGAGSKTTLQQQVASVGAQAIFIPHWSSTNRGWHDQNTDGEFSVPVFVSSCETYLGLLGQGNTFQDGSATFAQAQIVSTGGIIYTNTRRFSLGADGVAIVTGTGSDSSKIHAWKYTGGTINVYHTLASHVNCDIHLLIQTAINDGLFDGVPQKAPIILNIDHINDGGDDNTGGFQEQPDRIATIGDVLRSAGGICYASHEVRWIDGTTGTTTGDLKTNLSSYSDVFKYIACHDHGVPYVTGSGGSANDAIANQETKANIDASYQATKTGIESLGLTVNTDFAHCASNAWGSNFSELAQPYTDLYSDPANTTAKAGYGFRALRCASTGNHIQSYPEIPIGGSATVVPVKHWIDNPTVVRGMVCIPNKDGGSANGDIVSLSKDHQAFAYNTFQLSTGVITYFHGTDFEDASIRTGSVSTDGAALTRGLLSWQTGAAYAAACPKCVKFGADIRDYWDVPTGVTEATVT